VDLQITALLEMREISIVWTGPLLGAFFAAGLVGALAYAARTDWPGSYRAQSLVLTFLAACGVVVVALSPDLLGITAGMVATGICAATLMVVRTLALRQALPKSLHPAAFSLNYAASCLGYIACAAIAATSLAAFDNPTAALLAGVGVVLLVAVAAEIREQTTSGRLLGSRRGEEAAPLEQVPFAPANAVERDGA
jgi:MFS family permease